MLSTTNEVNLYRTSREISCSFSLNEELSEERIKRDRQTNTNTTQSKSVESRKERNNQEKWNAVVHLNSLIMSKCLKADSLRRYFRFFLSLSLRLLFGLSIITNAIKFLKGEFH